MLKNIFGGNPKVGELSIDNIKITSELNKCSNNLNLTFGSTQMGRSTLRGWGSSMKVF